MDRSDEGGDPACWSHLFDEEADLADPDPEVVSDVEDERAGSAVEREEQVRS